MSTYLEKRNLMKQGKLETDQQARSRTSGKNGISRQSAKAKQKAIDIAQLHKTDGAFYMGIWAERIHIDFETAEPIYGEAKILYFHHVLEKKNYPQYRHCKWNIVLLSWTNHDQVGLFLDKMPKVKAYTQKLLKLHEEGKLAKIDPNKQFIN